MTPARSLLPLAPRQREAPPAATSAMEAFAHSAQAFPRHEQVVPQASAAINVEAITSQVIQQLDRQLIAYRERMGRS